MIDIQQATITFCSISEAVSYSIRLNFSRCGLYLMPLGNAATRWDSSQYRLNLPINKTDINLYFMHTYMYK
jgi:hypothetical protein